MSARAWHDFWAGHHQHVTALLTSRGTSSGISLLRCSLAGVRYIKPHGMRRTCASLLAALDVHPGSPCASCVTARSP